MASLALREVTKRFDAVTAVDRLSIEVHPGRIFGLLGPNGAGKTSTIRMIAHIIAPDSGVIELDGEKVSLETQRRQGYLPEERGLYRRMKVGEHLIYLARLKGLSRKEARSAVELWLDRFGAGSWFSKRIDQLSKGMQQKIQFVATVVHDPELLIFDEPFSGLDPINSDVLREVIFGLREKGKMILFASHRMEQVEQICDDICLMADGSAVVSGALRDVKRNAGRNIIEVEFEGNGQFAGHLDADDAVEILEVKSGLVRLRIREARVASEVLDLARRHVEILRFEIMEPSLNEIFIDAVRKHGERRSNGPAGSSS